MKVSIILFLGEMSMLHVLLAKYRWQGAVCLAVGQKKTKRNKERILSCTETKTYIHQYDLK